MKTFNNLVVFALVAILLTACVPDLMGTPSPEAAQSSAQSAQPAAPQAPQATPTAVQHDAVEPATAPAVSAEAVAQDCPATLAPIGSAEDLVAEWTVAGSAAMTLNDPTAETVALMAQNCVDAKETRLVYVHSASGILNVYDALGTLIYSRSFDKDWLAAVELPTGYKISITNVSFNDNTGHFNTWLVAYGVPEGLDFATAGAYTVYLYEGYTGDKAVDTAAHAFWGLPADFKRGQDPAPYAVFVSADGKETVYEDGQIQQ